MWNNCWGLDMEKIWVFNPKPLWRANLCGGWLATYEGFKHFTRTEINT